MRAARRAWLRRSLLPAPTPEVLARQIAAAAGAGRYTEWDRYRDYRRVLLGTQEGRRVLNDILEACGVYRPSHVRGETHETARREGRREIGLMILHRMNFEPAERPAQAEREGGTHG